jgi:hypothetical protein
MKKNRWYDQHEELAAHFETLKTIPKRQLNGLLKDLITLGRLLHPNLFEEHIFEYPLDPKKRRWYDDDPYLWIVINGLRYAEDEVINKVVAFFDKQISTIQNKLAKKKNSITKVVKKTATKKTVKKSSGKSKKSVNKVKVPKKAVKKSAAKPKTKKTAVKPKVKKAVPRRK